MVKVSFGMQAAIFILVSFWRIRLMALAFTFTVMGHDMKVSGFRMCKKVKARKSGRMVQDILALTRTE